MAVSTYTSTIYKNNSPKAVHTGDQSVSGTIVHGAGTVGDIIFLAKVPHGAMIVDFHEYHTSGESAATYDFGFNGGVASGGAANSSCLISGGAFKVENRWTFATWPAAFPAVISISDNNPIRYVALTAKAAAGTFTISCTINFSLIYRVDGPYPQGGGAGT